MMDNPIMGVDGDALPRVMVLDDHVDTLVALGRLLSKIPVDAIPVTTCAAARQAATALGPFDVLLTDLNIPDGDGLALAAELRAAHGCRVVVMSGRDQPDDGLPDGIDAWLLKPVAIARLLDAVASLAAR